MSGQTRHYWQLEAFARKNGQQPTVIITSDIVLCDMYIVYIVYVRQSDYMIIVQVIQEEEEDIQQQNAASEQQQTHQRTGSFNEALSRVCSLVMCVLYKQWA